ncbi:Hypothetical predicted protein [Olea europaea subsp. europaea]|uniref:Uncharacterized protein n=1 Tax=Olea europaea subsp. europaea TaxID=158383 RepID=A0A8S0R390_OLEEU|nr:Hypothetical predicted protein [Olea europaea subsp. europaea]
MAAEFDDGKFWLPPQFLTDDDLLISGQSKIKQTKQTEDFSFTFGNSIGSFSDLSSPVESVMGSTETESDEDDYMTELTRKMAQSTFQDFSYPVDNKQGSWVSGSPQSTLCSVMGRCGCNLGSDRQSPSCLSKVSSPQDANRRNSTSLDLLPAAAREVARMRMMEETLGFYSNNYRGGVEGLSVPPRIRGAATVPPNNQNRGSGFYPNNSYHLFQHLQASQFLHLKGRQMMKQPQHGQMKSGYLQMVQNNVRPNGLSMDARSTVQQSQKQQQPGSGMRALFLGDTGTKKERTGTGVFLPRKVGVPTETRKKSGCSTVLLPDRVVQALNLNLESMDSQPQIRANGNFTPDYGDYFLLFSILFTILISYMLSQFLDSLCSCCCEVWK